MLAAIPRCVKLVFNLSGDSPSMTNNAIFPAVRRTCFEGIAPPAAATADYV
jgi:hypothetical protein